MVDTVTCMVINVTLNLKGCLTVIKLFGYNDIIFIGSQVVGGKCLMHDCHGGREYITFYVFLFEHAGIHQLFYISVCGPSSRAINH